MWMNLRGYLNCGVIVECLVPHQCLPSLVRVPLPLAGNEPGHWVCGIHGNGGSRMVTQLTEHGRVDRLLFLKTIATLVETLSPLEAERDFSKVSQLALVCFRGSAHLLNYLALGMK